MPCHELHASRLVSRLAQIITTASRPATNGITTSSHSSENPRVCLLAHPFSWGCQAKLLGGSKLGNVITNDDQKIPGQCNLVVALEQLQLRRAQEH
jgi:hypothetical protein